MSVKCPKCGSAAVVLEDIYNTAGNGGSGDTIIDYCIGHCDNCGAKLMWEDIYVYKESTIPTIED